MHRTEVDQSKLPQIEDIQEYMETLKERLKPLLKEQLFKDECNKTLQQEDCLGLKKIIEAYLKENTNVVPEKHVEIEVTATPEELEERKMTVTFYPLDDYGVEMIRKMQG